MWLESESKLNEFLTRHNISQINIDFTKNFVYLAWGVYSNPRYLHPQLTELEITGVVFDNGKLSRAASKSVMTGGAEKEGKFIFVILVIPKNYIK